MSRHTEGVGSKALRRVFEGEKEDHYYYNNVTGASEIISLCVDDVPVVAKTAVVPSSSSNSSVLRLQRRK